MINFSNSSRSWGINFFRYNFFPLPCLCLNFFPLSFFFWYQFYFKVFPLSFLLSFSFHYHFYVIIISRYHFYVIIFSVIILSFIIFILSFFVIISYSRKRDTLSPKYLSEGGGAESVQFTLFYKSNLTERLFSGPCFYLKRICKKW